MTFGPYLRTLSAVACGSILTFFATQIFYTQKLGLPLRIGVIVVIACVGVAGIAAILSPDEDEQPPSEKLYTADEVAALLAAVQAGRLVPAEPLACKYCGQPAPEATAIDGTRYHRRCFQAAYHTGKT